MWTFLSFSRKHLLAASLGTGTHVAWLWFWEDSWHPPAWCSAPSPPAWSTCTLAWGSWQVSPRICMSKKRWNHPQEHFTWTCLWFGQTNTNSYFYVIHIFKPWHESHQVLRFSYRGEKGLCRSGLFYVCCMTVTKWITLNSDYCVLSLQALGSPCPTPRPSPWWEPISLRGRPWPMVSPCLGVALERLSWRLLCSSWLTTTRGVARCSFLGALPPTCVSAGLCCGPSSTKRTKSARYPWTQSAATMSKPHWQAPRRSHSRPRQTVSFVLLPPLPPLPPPYPSLASSPYMSTASCSCRTSWCWRALSCSWPMVAACPSSTWCHMHWTSGSATTRLPSSCPSWVSSTSLGISLLDGLLTGGMASSFHLFFASDKI